MSDRGQLGEARELGGEPSRARRRALGRILRPRALAIQENTLGHAYRATNFLGFGAVGAKRWASISGRGVPKFLDALEADDAERARILGEARIFISELRAAGFQRFAVKPLVNLAFRLALRDVVAHAREEGFDPEELGDELHVFQRALEARLLYR